MSNQQPPAAASSACVHECVAAWAACTPEAPALLAPGREALSYGALWQQVQGIAARLRAAGLARTDRVAVVLPNGPDAAVAFLGVSAAAVCAPLNPAYGESELAFYFDDLAARALVTAPGDDSPARHVAAARGIPVVEMTAEGTAGGGDLFTSEEVALVLHTSGTTARPKLVPLTHANLLASARAVAASLALTPTDRAMNLMPLFHIHGLVGVLASSLATGASVVCAPGFTPDFLAWVREFGATWYSAVPTLHQAAREQAAAQPALLEDLRLRVLRSCSASLAPQLMEELERTFGVPVLEAYGMTEAAHQMASNPLPPAARKPGSVGRAAGPEVAVMDPAGALLPAGQTGEVVIRGANVTAGYHDNPEANRVAFAHGWFHTGDQGYLDGEGYLFLTGRLKEIINRGGEKIAPREVEEALLRHPAVAQVVCFALPHPRLGEDVGAAVVLRPGARITAEALRAFLSDSLAAFKVPSRIVFLKELPKGPTGKLQRIGLAEKLGLTVAPRELLPPRTETEAAVAAIWREVFKLEEVGVEESFLDLGGDSILAEQILARLRAYSGLEIGLGDLFGTPTVAAQAALLATKQTQEVAAALEELTALTAADEPFPAGGRGDD